MSAAARDPYLSIEGHGIKAIAKQLNAKGAGQARRPSRIASGEITARTTALQTDEGPRPIMRPAYTYGVRA
jgi:hypothetical protein